MEQWCNKILYLFSLYQRNSSPAGIVQNGYRNGSRNDGVNSGFKLTHF